MKRTSVHCLVSGCAERAVTRLDGEGRWYTYPFCNAHLRNDRNRVDIEDEDVANRLVPQRSLQDFRDRPGTARALTEYLSEMPIDRLSQYCSAVLESASGVKLPVSIRRRGRYLRRSIVDAATA